MPTTLWHRWHYTQSFVLGRIQGRGFLPGELMLSTCDPATHGINYDAIGWLYFPFHLPFWVFADLLLLLFFLFFPPVEGET